jgi:hypothetical protein
MNDNMLSVSRDIIVDASFPHDVGIVDSTIMESDMTFMSAVWCAISALCCVIVVIVVGIISAVSLFPFDVGIGVVMALLCYVIVAMDVGIALYDLKHGTVGWTLLYHSVRRVKELLGSSILVNFLVYVGCLPTTLRGAFGIGGFVGSLRITVL